MNRAREIVQALKGRWSGSSGMCCCPAHPDRSPSLSVRESDNGRILVHFFRGCDPRDVIDALRRLSLWPEQPTAKKNGFDFNLAGEQRRPPERTTSKPADDDAGRIHRALTIWGEAKPIDGTVASTYLAKREIDLAQLPSELDRALRWHPACPWEAGKHGAMVALMTNAATGEPKAIHRTALTPDGDKVDRKMLGATKGCIVRLWPDETVLEGLVIGEGIETVLAAATCIEHAGTLLQPAWACCTAGLLAAFPALAGIEALTILVDKDESGRGEEAAEKCAERWADAGCEVILLTPDAIGDFNDIARGAADED